MTYIIYCWLFPIHFYGTYCLTRNLLRWFKEGRKPSAKEVAAFRAQVHTGTVLPHAEPRVL